MDNVIHSAGVADQECGPGEAERAGRELVPTGSCGTVRQMPSYVGNDSLTLQSVASKLRAGWTGGSLASAMEDNQFWHCCNVSWRLTCRCSSLSRH